MIIQKECAIVIIGASGNLALTKLLPALYNNYTAGSMPQSFTITGYARTAMSREKFQKVVAENIRKYVDETNIESRLFDEFLGRLHYVGGQYDSAEDFLRLKNKLETRTQKFKNKNILFYLSIPPSVFGPVINSLKKSGSIQKGAHSPHNVIVEKPFGYDTDSAEELNALLYEVFDEKQIYRIDHYLGKEAIQNLMVLRFANLIFEPVWNRDYIDSVTVTWQEDLSVGSRGGYFDQAGIIRDVMQNHLLQMTALVAMEQPSSLDGEAIQDEKVKVLKSIEPFTEKDVILGQYTNGVASGKPVIGYKEEESVPNDSIRETFAMIKFAVNNRRWSGVPFYMSAGKALQKSGTEIIVQFKEVPGDIFRAVSPNHHPNKLIIRVQPDAALLFHITNKVPGRGTVLKDIKLDFSYGAGFKQEMPGAYDRLLLDAINGDKTLFINYEELIHSWKMFTPILDKIDAGKISLYDYPAGTGGPEEVANL